MNSLAKSHYPQIRFYEGQKMLWNPVSKQRYKIRPEEVVRLRIVDALLVENLWSANRIGFEIPLHLQPDSTAKRADIVCYNKAFDPELLIECKAPTITLSEHTAVQAASYNAQLAARYIMLSNGFEDSLYRTGSEEGIRTVPTTTLLPEITPANRNIEYWTDRGFAGTYLKPQFRSEITDLLNRWYLSTDLPVRYLRIPQQIDQIWLSHAYLNYKIDDENEIDLCVTASAEGSTHLLAIWTQHHQQQGLMHINLDAALSEVSPHLFIYGPGFQKSTELSYFQMRLEMVTSSPKPVAEACRRLFEQAQSSR